MDTLDKEKRMDRAPEGSAHVEGPRFRFDPNKYSEDKLEVVTHKEGPMLVLAVAGSGKTYAITHRIAYLIDCCGVSPSSIVGVSFTRKAARELTKRVGLLVGKEKAHQCQLSTFHSLGLEILRKHIHLLGWKTPFTIFDEADQKRIVKDVCKNIRFVGTGFDPDKLLTKISLTKNHGCEPGDMFPVWSPLRPRFIKIYNDYQLTLKAMNAVDFDDLIKMPGDLFDQYPDILAEYEEKWKYLLVDEYQDTNALQFRLIRQLCSHHANIMVVGDDDQAIYGFRGADSNHILSFPNMFDQVKVVKLEYNFRSTGHILNAANGVIEKNEKRYPKFLKTAGGDGEKVRCFSVPSPEEEGAFVAEQIEQERTARNLKYSDLAVLYRTNAQSANIEKGLMDRQIPYKIVGGTKFFEHSEIRDLVFYMRSALSLEDDLALRRIVNVPRRGISAEMLDSIDQATKSEDITFFEALKRTAEGSALKATSRLKLNQLVDTLETFHARFLAQSEPMYKTMRDLIETIHFRDHIASTSTNDVQANIRVENIREFLSDLALFENIQGRDLMGYLHKIVLEAPKQEKDEDSDVVTLMTLHSSKGLEFKSVYMVGCEENLIPHSNALETNDPAAIEEERRLFYVGITRAKNYLTLTRCEKRRKLNESYDSPASRFLLDISDEHAIFAQSRSKTAQENEMKAKEIKKANLAAIRALLSSSLFLLCFGCASVPESVRPDDAIQRAIEQRDCDGVYAAMSDDVRAHFETKALFCRYFEQNDVLFDAWSAHLNDAFSSGDYSHYAYLADDPEGAMRLKESADGHWAFESLREPRQKEELSKAFIDYVWTRQFVLLLQDHLAKTEPIMGNVILSEVMRALGLGESCASVEYEGPLARVTLNHKVQILFKYQKARREDFIDNGMGEWELYRCFLYK